MKAMKLTRQHQLVPHHHW